MSAVFNKGSKKRGFCYFRKGIFARYFQNISIKRSPIAFDKHSVGVQLTVGNIHDKGQ